MTELQTIAARLAAACADVGQVAPDRRNSHDGYDYATVHKVAGIVREALAKHGLAMVPRNTIVLDDAEVASKRGTAGHRVTVLVDWLVTGAMPDGDAPITLTTTGEAIDYSDKAMGKAQQYARKQALISVLNLATGDDPEADSPDAAPVAGPEVQRLATLVDLFAGDKKALGAAMKARGVKSAELADDKVWKVAVEAAREAFAAPAEREAKPADPDVVTEPQRRALEAAAGQSGIGHDGLKKLAAHLFGVDSTTKIPAAQFEALMNLVEAGATPAGEEVDGGEA